MPWHTITWQTTMLLHSRAAYFAEYLPKRYVTIALTLNHDPNAQSHP